MPFRERWWIEGTLEVISGLHIGDGSTTRRPDADDYSALWRNEKDEKGHPVRATVDVNATAMGLGGQSGETPIIPGSALKGVLRTWLESAYLDGDAPRIVESLLGHTLDRVDYGSRAEATFLDSFLESSPDEDGMGRFWCGKRKTCVAPGVSIDRGTRSASDEKLHFHEFVPAGSIFKVKLPLSLSDPEGHLPYLLAALEAFNKSPRGRIRLGGRTRKGWGLLKWNLTGLRRLTEADARLGLSAALNNPATITAGFPQGTALSLKDLDSWRDLALLQRDKAKRRRLLRLQLKLASDSPFLVNDTARTQYEEAESDHLPLRVTADGDYLLPGESLEGALRSQAERIVRTILQDRNAAWRADQDQRNAPAFRNVSEFREDMQKLCPVSLLFGAPGWASPLSTGAFVGGADVPERKQNFIAIDRMTGGGANHLKFDAKAPPHCALEGEIELDLDALTAAVGDVWPAVLLPIVLRDLDEQDILLGFGAAKGYGRFHIESCKVEAGTQPADQLLASLLTWPRPPVPEGLTTIQDWIAKVEESGRRFSEHQASVEVAQ